MFLVFVNETAEAQMEWKVCCHIILNACSAPLQLTVTLRVLAQRDAEGTNVPDAGALVQKLSWEQLLKLVTSQGFYWSGR